MHSSTPTCSGLTSRTEVLEKLRKQIIRVKGLDSAFCQWPFKVNQHVDEIRKDVSTRLNSLFAHHPKLEMLIAGDYGLFGAAWWPCASLERCRIVTYLSIWLFMWDDEIDLDDGEYWADFGLAQKYRDKTIKFVRSRLGIDNTNAISTTGNAVIDSFDVIGEAMQKSCSIEQRETFMSELAFFMQKSEVEQRLRLQSQMVTIGDFWDFRLGTSAVRVVLCFNEYGNESLLPTHIMQDRDMAALWDLTNANICNVNDLLSVKKEVERGATESLIPILFATRRDAQAVADEVMASVNRSIREFDTVAAGMIDRLSEEEDPQLVRALVKFVEGCRYYCTGNLSWSLSTGRYGIHQDLAQHEIVIRI